MLPSEMGPGRRGPVRYMLGSVLLETGELDRAVEILRDAIADLDSVGDALLAAKATGNLAGALFRQGDLLQAQSAVKSELESYRRLRLSPQTVFPLGHLGLIAAAQGRYAEARDLLEEAVEVGEEHGNQRAVDAFRAHLEALPSP